MRADRLPAVGDGATGAPFFHRERAVPASVWTQEVITLGVEAGEILAAGEPGEVVPSFAVLGLVEDDAVLDLDLADGVVALEVGGVVVGVPEAPFDRAEERDVGRGFPLVGHSGAPDLEVLAERHEVRGLGVDARGARADRGVAHAVSALVVVHLAADRLPAGTPIGAGVVVAHVDVAAADVEGGVVVAVAGQTPQTGILVERVAPGGVGDEPEIVFRAEIVDPGQGRVRPRDDIFPSRVVEPSEPHRCLRSLPVVDGLPQCTAAAAAVATVAGSTPRQDVRSGVLAADLSARQAEARARPVCEPARSRAGPPGRSARWPWPPRPDRSRRSRAPGGRCRQPQSPRRRHPSRRACR